MAFYRAHVLVCGGTGCTSSKSLDIIDAFEREIKDYGLDKEIKVVRTGCFGLCALGPIMIVYPEGCFYSEVKVEDIPEYKWRDKGCALGRLCAGLEDNEKMLLAIPYKNVLPKSNVVFMTKNGMIKVSDMEEYAVKKNKFNSITLKNDDVLVNVEIQKEESSILYITSSGMSKYVIEKTI